MIDSLVKITYLKYILKMRVETDTKTRKKLRKADSV